MINKAMFPPPEDQLNDFTTIVRYRCLNERFGYKCRVKLRDGRWVDIKYKKESGDHIFHTEKWDFCWNADGSSVTRDDFDMVEIEDNNTPDKPR